MIKENDSMTFSHDVWFFKSASFFDTYSLIKSDDWVKSIVMMTWNFFGKITLELFWNCTRLGSL